SSGSFTRQRIRSRRGGIASSGRSKSGWSRRSLRRSCSPLGGKSYEQADEAGTVMDREGEPAPAGATHSAGGFGEILPCCTSGRRHGHLRQPARLWGQLAGPEGAGARVHGEGEVHLHRPAI